MARPLHAAAGHPAGDVYPLTVTETGARGDKTLHARYTVTFDAARGRYRVPKALRTGY